MNIEVSEKADHQAVISVQGRLDASNAGDLKEKLKALVQKGFTRLVLDMAEVQYIDSSGLGALVSGLKTARTENGDLFLANIGPQTKVALALTRLDKVFRTSDNVVSST